MNFSNPVNLLIAGIYYVLVGILTLFAFFGVYILIRYGKSRVFAFTTALIFCFIFLNILAESYKTLQILLSFSL